MEEYLAECVFPEADVSVVKDVKYDAIVLERLKNEPEKMSLKRVLRKSLCRISQIEENTEEIPFVCNKGNNARTGS